MIDWFKIRHFKASEFKNPDQLDERLVYRLDDTRAMAKTSIQITSSFRPLRGKRKSAHQPDGNGKYHGVDIACTNSRQRYRIIAAAIEAGFMRIGIYDRHIHLDTAKSGFDQIVIWWGKSR